MINYIWPTFRLEYNPVTGRTTTYYKNAWSGCDPNPDDEFHAKRLGITNKLHRLSHELAHHLIGIYYYKSDSSPVVFRDAHHLPQPPEESCLEEWRVTTLQYFAHEKDCDYGALIDFKKSGLDPNNLKNELRWMLQIPQTRDNIDVIFK